MKDTQKNYMNIMEESIKGLKQAPERYKPSNFWDPWVTRLFDDMEKFGFNHFKETSSCHALFVAHYGYPFNEISTEIKTEFIKLAEQKNLSNKQIEFLEFYLSGNMNAISDYRVLVAADKGPACGLDFSKFSEGSIGSPQEQFNFEGKIYSRHSLNYLHQLLFLRECMGDFTPTTYMEIGGGWGSLGEVLLKTGAPELKYIDVDISPSCCIAEYYLRETFTNKQVYGYMNSIENSEIKISDLPNISVLPSWKIESLKGTIDVFVNSISFQEMEPEIVDNYLKVISTLKPKFIMLRNLREGKNTVPDETDNSHVIEPVERNFYINRLEQHGYTLCGENVIPFGRKTIDGFHSEILVFSI